MSNPHENIVKQKLNDTQLRENLSNAMHTLQRNRKNLIEKRFNEWEDLRERGKKAKNNALSHLDELLVRFEQNATKNGFKVNWASTQQEACEIIYTLMIEKNMKGLNI